MLYKKKHNLYFEMNHWIQMKYLQDQVPDYHQVLVRQKQPFQKRKRLLILRASHGAFPSSVGKGNPSRLSTTLRARGNTYIFKVSNEPLSLTDKFFTISEHLNDKELKSQETARSLMISSIFVKKISSIFYSSRTTDGSTRACA